MQCARPFVRSVVSRCTLSGLRLCSVSLSDSTSSKGSSTKKETPQKTKPQQASTTAAKKMATPETKSDNKSYKVPEYYGHNEWSFYDIDSTMNKFRLPQPSSIK
ncbi:NADH dehydrogenase [ubiquinone] flavoprotein 3, mitochondrial-like [Gigantopelta aegis]|uniref:NADH dehydrogenase [ubiquinone] flavoprotein 3, mitochondrial-like n=1 Tax=Gigantopelta aegis TaxID=1735272 RepID=UPI001B88DB07|nr:NADH dehydrogenase [ubiquinone] flavoprotein 3, mitochondrial-like [Gigantopelta aegis]